MKKSWVAVPLAALALIPPLGVAPAAAAAKDGARLSKPFVQCRLTDPLQLRSIDAECAEISVAENGKTSSRQITLSVARLPAINRSKQIDPIMILTGGPGQGAQLTFTDVSPVFSRAGRERDILLLDQRGTGRSNGLSCDAEGKALGGNLAFDAAAFIRLNEQCLERLSSGNDLSAYTTSHAVQDLDAVRALLGYEKLNLYAVSYGTRVAQHYARRYPSRVRSMVLDGVVAPHTVLGPRISLDAQLALDGIWQRCADDKACRETFGDIRATTRSLLAQLTRSTQRLQLPHPRTGVMTAFDFGAEQLAVVLRFSSYDPGFAAMLPLVVTEATKGNFRPVGTLFLLTTASIQEVIALGMHNSVICSEDVPRFGTIDVDRAAVEATYLGAAFLDALPAICRQWPRGQVDGDFHSPLVTSIPTLLLSGTLDPVTPPADADRVARNLKNSKHLVFKNSGHGQLGLKCMDRVLADFYSGISPKTLDTSCLDRRMQPPFWISLAGPAP